MRSEKLRPQSTSLECVLNACKTNESELEENQPSRFKCRWEGGGPQHLKTFVAIKVKNSSIFYGYLCLLKSGAAQKKDCEWGGRCGVETKGIPFETRKRNENRWD